MITRRIAQSSFLFFILLALGGLVLCLDAGELAQSTAAAGDFVVTTTSPAAGEIADPASSVTATFSTAVDPFTVSTAAMAVHGQMTGIYEGTLAQPLTNTLRFTANYPFKPGEMIAVTISPALQSETGDALVRPYTWYFTAATGGATGAGSGRFYAWASAEGWEGTAACVCDLDGDRDLDAVLMSDGLSYDARGQIWINDRQAHFSKGQEFPLKYGGSVMCGDYDGDGDLDVAAGSIEEAPQLWRNNGAAQFTVEGAGLELAGNVRAQGDVDQDGDIDLFVANEVNGRFWFNDGGGQFSAGEQVFADNGFVLYGVALADFDEDMDLDLALDDGMDQNGDQVMRLYKNNGLGEFPTQFPKIKLPDSLRVINTGDLDGDGDFDLYIQGLVLSNDGYGNFTQTQTVNSGHPQGDARAGDLNGDGHLDIFVSGGEWLSALINDGTGHFSSTSQYVRHETQSLQLGDLDGDGDLDAFFANSDRGRRGVWLNRNQVQPPSFWVEETIPAANDISAAPDGSIAAEFNKAVDAATLHAGSFLIHGTQTPGMTGTIAGAGSQATFAPAAAFKAGETAIASLTTAVSSAGAEALHGYSWQFTTAAERGTGNLLVKQALNHSAVSHVALGDLDGDGDVDVVVAECEPGEPLRKTHAGVWINNGSAGFSQAASLATTCNLGLGLGDLDSDGDLDVFMAGFEGNQIWTNNGDGTFHKKGGPFGEVSNRAVALADLQHDGHLDAVIINADGQGTIWFNDGNGLFSDTGQLLAMSIDAKTLALGDLDADGHIDALPAGDWGAMVLRNDGLGFFDEGGQLPEVTPANDVVLADFDRDGDLDVLLTGSYDTSIWKNNGTAKFQRYLQLTELGGLSAVTADFQADGDLDILVDTYDEHRLYLNDGAGQFQLHKRKLAELTSVSMGAADLNGDGAVDAFLANGDGEPNVVWLNAAQQSFVPAICK